MKLLDFIKQGWPVVTNEGDKCRVVCTDAKYTSIKDGKNIEKPLVVLQEARVGDYELVLRAAADGFVEATAYGELRLNPKPLDEVRPIYIYTDTHEKKLGRACSTIAEACEALSEKHRGCEPAGYAVITYVPLTDEHEYMKKIAEANRKEDEE